MSEVNHGSFYYPQCAIKLKLRLEDFGDKSADLSKTNFEITCLAKKVNVEINDYTTADTFNCELDYDNFPFDPRSIRACGIVISIEDMGSLYKEDGTPQKIKINKDNMVFVGFADEESISFDDGSRTVKLEGRDFTSLLIDRKFTDGHINLDKPLNEVVSSLIAGIEETKDLKVEFRGVTEFPVLSSFYSDKTNLSGKKNIKNNDTYWEVIQNIVADAGLIAYIELDKLVVTKPRTLYSKGQTNRRFVYGQNLKNLEFSRKIGRKKGFNIVVRSLNLESKEVLEAFIPKESSNEWSIESGIANVEVKLPKVKPNVGTEKENEASQNNEEGEAAPYIAFRVSNVSNKKQLIEIGQSIYEEMSRQQIEGSFDTKEIAVKYLDNYGRQTLFNVLKLRVGTPIYIDLAIKDKRAIDSIKSRSGIEGYLVGKSYDKRVARSLSESLSKAKVPFYTKSVSFEMDSQTGFSCKVQFINFIEVKT